MIRRLGVEFAGDGQKLPKGRRQDVVEQITVVELNPLVAVHHLGQLVTGQRTSSCQKWNGRMRPERISRRTAKPGGLM